VVISKPSEVAAEAEEAEEAAAAVEAEAAVAEADPEVAVGVAVPQRPSAAATTENVPTNDPSRAPASSAQVSDLAAVPKSPQKGT